MPEWVEWVFEGIGTEIISLVIGAAIGGVAGFHICKHRVKFVQTQKAGSHAKQYQKGVSHQKNGESQAKDRDAAATFGQKQIAGDEVKQVQIGEWDDA